MSTSRNSLPPEVLANVSSCLRQYHCMAFLVVRRGSPGGKRCKFYPRWFQNIFDTYCNSDKGSDRVLLQRKGFSNICMVPTQVMLSWEQVLCFVVDFMMECEIAKLHFFGPYAAPEFHDVVFLKGPRCHAVSVCCKDSWSRHAIIVHNGSADITIWSYRWGKRGASGTGTSTLAGIFWLLMFTKRQKSFSKRSCFESIFCAPKTVPQTMFSLAKDAKASFFCVLEFVDLF